MQNKIYFCISYIDFKYYVISFYPFNTLAKFEIENNKTL